MLRVHVAYANLVDLGYDMNRRLKTVLQDHNISIPYPTQTIKYIHEPGADTPAEKP